MITGFCFVSASDSEVAVEESALFCLRLGSFGCAFRRLLLLSGLKVAPGWEGLEYPERPIACAVDNLPFLFGSIRPSLRIGRKGEKLPFSS